MAKKKKTKARSVSAMAKALVSSDKRQSIRFEPDPGTIAWIDFESKSKEPFSPSIPALVSEESHRGCGLVALMTPKLKVGSICKVKVGHSGALKAEVRWRVELDSQTVRLGVMYLE